MMVPSASGRFRDSTVPWEEFTVCAILRVQSLEQERKQSTQYVNGNTKGNRERRKGHTQRNVGNIQCSRLL